MNLCSQLSLIVNRNACNLGKSVDIALEKFKVPCQKVPNTLPLKGHAPKSRKLHKNGENRGNFSNVFGPTSVTKWELQKNRPVFNLHTFNECSTSFSWL